MTLANFQALMFNSFGQEDWIKLKFGTNVQHIEKVDSTNSGILDKGFIREFSK